MNTTSNDQKYKEGGFDIASGHQKRNHEMSPRLQEFYVYVTKDCNLRCAYCDGVGINWKSRNLTTSIQNIDAVKKFVLGRNSDGEKAIIFYGGEPLMNQSLIRSIIHDTAGSGLKYVLHTNGILLDTIDPYVLENLDYMFVSVDGYEQLHDRFRGEGTFARIMKNVLDLPDAFHGKTVARLTILPYASVYTSVMGVINAFDNIYWQLENSSTLWSPGTIRSFTARYDQDLDTIIEFWLASLKKGQLWNLIPFQAILSSLLLDRAHPFMRCGCSNSLAFIDTDGQVYACDKVLGNPDYRIGNVFDETLDRRKVQRSHFHSLCEQCEVRYICGGRCMVELLTFPDRKILFYCETVKMLVNKMKSKLPVVEALIQDHTISLGDLDNPVMAYTEQIP